MTEIGRRALIGATGLAAMTVFVGCAPSDRGSPTGPAPEGSPDTIPGPDPSNGGRALLVFFSRPGENYWEGGRRDLDVGNTKVVARQIADRLGCDVFEILAADPYPHEYDPTVERNRREQDDDARPSIDGEIPDLSGYDTVLLGSPVWGTRAPMIVRTFLDGTGSLAGKTVRPFLTYAVGEGSVFRDYEELCPDATVEDVLAIRGEDATDSGAGIDAWLWRR